MRLQAGVLLHKCQYIQVLERGLDLIGSQLTRLAVSGIRDRRCDAGERFISEKEGRSWPANSKATFALFFGNRGFFPASLMASARRELPQAVKSAGCDSIMMEESATRHGAVETPAEGAKYAEFLKRNAGKYDGVVLSLPNFGDETGAIAALQGLRRADPDPGLSGRTGQDVAGAAPRRVLREVLDHGRVPSERAGVHGVEAAHGLAEGQGVRRATGLFRAGLPRGEEDEEHDGRRGRRAHHGVQDRALRRAGAAAERDHGRDLRPVRHLRARAQREPVRRGLPREGGEDEVVHRLERRAGARRSTRSCGWASCSTT